MSWGDKEELLSLHTHTKCPLPFLAHFFLLFSYIHTYLKPLTILFCHCSHNQAPLSVLCTLPSIPSHSPALSPPHDPLLCGYVCWRVSLWFSLWTPGLQSYRRQFSNVGFPGGSVVDLTPALRKAYRAPKERTDQVVNLSPHPAPLWHGCSLGIRGSGYIYHLAPVAGQEHNPEFQVCKSLECQGAHKSYHGQSAELLPPPPLRLARGGVWAYIGEQL